MTTCLDCGFNHVSNVFIVGFDEDDLAIMECPKCGSDNCVKDIEAKEKGYEVTPLENMAEAVEEVAKE